MRSKVTDETRREIIAVREVMVRRPFGVVLVSTTIKFPDK